MFHLLQGDLRTLYIYNKNNDAEEGCNTISDGGDDIRPAGSGRGVMTINHRGACNTVTCKTN